MEPAPTTPVRRLSSKSSLRSFFARDKSANKSNKYGMLTEIEEGLPPMRQKSHDSDGPLSPDRCPTPKTAVSTKSFVSSPLTPVTTHLTKPPPRPRAETGDTTPGLADRGWKPPPLFQAYPQAIKDACLWAPALSADYILRIQATKRREQDGRATANGDIGERGRKKDEKKKHFRSLSETIGRTEWGQKIFVLATSGYILQYPGGGKNDRLPEKMLQLGPKSVAFASDAIPGKHFVLQVSQNMEDDDNDSTAPSETPKSLRSRFGFHRSPARRLVRSFLLVFETPERMSSWLLAVRAEIESRGGRKYVSEKSSGGDEDDELRPKPSVRQIVKRDPDRYSKVYLQPQPAGNADETERSTQLSVHSRRSSYTSFNRRSLVRTESRESQSTARTDNPAPTTTTEPSFTSTRFGSSSEHDNVPTSPPLGSEASYSTSHQEDNAGIPVQSPPLSSPSRRRSLLMYNKGPIPSSDSTRLPRTPSDASKTLPTRSTSPPAPNFSVPSFSRRFAAKPGQPPTSQLPHPPQGRYGSRIAAFPSPPQSPIKSTSSFDRGDTNEKSALSPVQKSLRGSNSEASLSTTAESSPKTRDLRMKASPRIPKPVTTSSTNPTSPPHPTNTPPDRQTDLPLRRDPSRTPTTTASSAGNNNSRLSTIYQNTTSGLNKRKSMPGLAGLGIVNPPSMPPPNYPLPKLPSPVKSANPAWPDNSTSRGPKSPPASAAGTGTGIPVQRGASRKGSVGTVGSASASASAKSTSGVSSPRAVVG